MNGTGTKSRSASPIATARPEKTTARPALAIVRTIASSAESSSASSSRKRQTIEQRVVDREPEADQLDEVRRVRT